MIGLLLGCCSVATNWFCSLSATSMWVTGSRGNAESWYFLSKRRGTKASTTTSPSRTLLWHNVSLNKVFLNVSKLCKQRVLEMLCRILRVRVSTGGRLRAQRIMLAAVVCSLRQQKRRIGWRGAAGVKGRPGLAPWPKSARRPHAARTPPAHRQSPKVLRCYMHPLWRCAHRVSYVYCIPHPYCKGLA